MSLKSSMETINKLAGIAFSLENRVNVMASEFGPCAPAVVAVLQDLKNLKCTINTMAAGFNGVAVLIPPSTQAPVAFFIGLKTVLHNVHYEISTGCIVAVVVLPYNHIKGAHAQYSGSSHNVVIDKKWFN